MQRREFLKTTMLGSAGMLVVPSLFAANSPIKPSHPEILVTPADRAAVRKKLKEAPWARQAFAAMKSRVDGYVRHCENDAQFMSSRLLMNWQTHYITPLVENSRSAGGEGTAPVPTPRFGGARDWATKYTALAKLEDLKPYNDHDGKVWLYNKETKQEEWADAGQTGRLFEIVNERIVRSAAEAGFIYWLTEDKVYAKYAAEIVWTYLNGFSFMQLPKILDGGRGLAQVIGFDSFEVIHEDIVTPLAQCYDFIYDQLCEQKRDVILIQAQLKRMADRVIDGGGATGNWNLNQARIITFASLGLEDNSAYADGKGRPYYVDLILNCRLPAQTGITHVIQEGFDQESALWPEAPGYAFGTVADVVRIASLVSADPEGKAVLAASILPRAALAQLNLIYPSGWSIGLGDTTNTRLNTVGLELLIASARERKANQLEDQLTVALQREIDSKFYDRSQQTDLVALTRYVPELKRTPPASAKLDRNYFGKPLNVLMQRNLADVENDSLVAAMYGTAGGHVHANGLAIELFGNGVIHGADPGRGSSYWQADHAEYYSQPPAHNTVIVNGRSNYSIGNGKIAMKVEMVEPDFGKAGVSPNIGFAQCSFKYNNPVAEQQRTLALIRPGTGSGFYFDVFRSRAETETGSFHDYLYHNIGQSLALSDAAGKPLAVSPSELLNSQNGCLKGYDYFSNEKSMDEAKSWRTTFIAKIKPETEHHMDLWMLGNASRRVFALDAPANHAVRDALPVEFSQISMPTILARQQGDAWQRPFVVIYEPHLGVDGAKIQNVRMAKLADVNATVAACVIAGRAGSDFQMVLMQDDQPNQFRKIENYNFQGSFGAAILREDLISELYLGNGKMLGDERTSLTAKENMPVNASLRRQGDGWIYSGSAAVSAVLAFSVPENALPSVAWSLWLHTTGGRQKIQAAKIQPETLAPGKAAIWVKCELPAAMNAQLSIQPS